MNSTTIIAVAPVHDVGPVDVVVTNTSGETRSLPAGFTYAVEETFTISGEITEMTDAGPVPVEGMRVEDLITHRFFITGADGFYTIAGVRQTGASIEAIKEGYVPEARR